MIWQDKEIYISPKVRKIYMIWRDKEDCVSESLKAIGI